jgi:acetyl-CoA acyltransferase
LKAQAEGKFDKQIVPITVANFINENGKKETKSYVVTKDEGPRAGTSLEALAGLRPVLLLMVVLHGNSSQMSDGAAFVLVMSEEMVKELNLAPIAFGKLRLCRSGAKNHGNGPVKAIQKHYKLD